MTDNELAKLIDQMYPEGLPASPTGDVIRRLPNKNGGKMVELPPSPAQGDLL